MDPTREIRPAMPQRKSVQCILIVGIGLLSLLSENCFAEDKKPDCNRILTELEKGQSAEQIAKAMGIQTSSVYSCEKNATKGIPPAAPSPTESPPLSVRRIAIAQNLLSALRQEPGCDCD